MTKPPNQRTRQAEKTKTKIYEVARRLFGERGYDQVGMDDIAGAAGVSVGTCYHHFASKYRIFQEVYERNDRFFLQEVPGLLISRTWPGKIIEFFSTFYGGMIENDGIELCRQLFVPTNDLFLRQDSGMMDGLAMVIQQAQDVGELTREKSPAELAEFLFVIARGVVFDWLLHSGSYKIKGRLEDHISCSLTAFLPR